MTPRTCTVVGKIPNLFVIPPSLIRLHTGFMYNDDNGPSTVDPQKWTKGGASVIRGCQGGAFGVKFHLYLNLSSRFPKAELSGMFEAEL
jgi:hypothetical protein